MKTGRFQAGVELAPPYRFACNTPPPCAHVGERQPRASRRARTVRARALLGGSSGAGGRAPPALFVELSRRGFVVAPPSHHCRDLLEGGPRRRQPVEQSRRRQMTRCDRTPPSSQRFVLVPLSEDLRSPSFSRQWWRAAMLLLCNFLLAAAISFRRCNDY